MARRTRPTKPTRQTRQTRSSPKNAVKHTKNAGNAGNAGNTYTNIMYGSPEGIGNNNCYAYAIDKFQDTGGKKLQPGELAGIRSDMDLCGCGSLKRRAEADLKSDLYRASDIFEPCKRGFYKIMAFLSKGKDYHWYRQHKDVLYRVKPGATLTDIERDLGTSLSRKADPVPRQSADGEDLVLLRGVNLWSHKQGLATGPLLRDACGNVIKDPRKACRNYGELNYKDFCGAWCVRSKAR